LNLCEKKVLDIFKYLFLAQCGGAYLEIVCSTIFLKMNILETVGYVSDMVGTIGGIVSAVGIIKLLAQKKREEQIVSVFFCVAEGNKTIFLPFEIVRRDVSRAEILGRMGMLPIQEKSGRFVVRGLLTPEFFKNLNEVREGKTSVLHIPITQKELEQFVL